MSRSSFINIALTVLCTFVLVGSVLATGSNDFRIEDYIPQKFTDLEWQLGGGLSVSGSHSDSDRGNLYGLDITEENDSKTRSNSFNLSSQLMYRYETVDRVLKLGGSISSNYSTYNNEGSSYRSDSSGIIQSYDYRNESYSRGFSLTPSFEARSYLKDDLFAGISGSATILFDDTPTEDRSSENYNRYQNDDYIRITSGTSVRDYEYHRRDRSVELRLTPGWGRVYEGQYAATSLYMVDELKKGGLLERDPSKKEMLELTEIIYQNRMAHEVDHRLAKIDALNAVTSYLTEIGAIANNGPISYVLIQDVWDFFPHTSRSFGKLVKLGIGWEYSYNKYERSRDVYSSRLHYQYHIDSVNVVDTLQNYQESYDDKNTTHSDLDNTFLTLSVEYHRPVSMRWQWDSFAELYYYIHAEGLRSRYHNYPSRRFSTSNVILYEMPGIDDYYQFYLGSYGTYIYSSRTSLQVYGSLSYDHFVAPIESDLNQSQTTKSWNGTIGSTLTYRLSIPTALTIKTYYRDQGQQNIYETDYRSDSESWNFSASISHYLY